MTDKGISGILPLWVMSALRAVAVIGLLVASRLSPVPLHTQGQEQRTGEALLPSTSTNTPTCSWAEKKEESSASSRDQEALIAVLLLRLQQAGITSSERLKEAQPSRTVPAKLCRNRPLSSSEPVVHRGEQFSSQWEPASSFSPEEPEPPALTRLSTGDQHQSSSELIMQHEETTAAAEEHDVPRSAKNQATESSAKRSQEAWVLLGTHNGHAHQSVPAPERFPVLDQTLGTPPTPLVVTPLHDQHNGNPLLQRAEPQHHEIQRDAQPVESDTGNWPLSSPEPQARHDESDAAGEDHQLATPSIRLQTAYLALQAEGRQMSGTALASRAGVRKQTALDWLQQQKPVSSASPQS